MKKLNRKTKIDLVSLTAHQLKKPLSSIKLSLEMLLGGDFGKITEEQKEIVEKILQKSKIMIYLTDDLLDMAKIDGKRHIHNLTLVDMQDFIESVVSSAKEDSRKKKIEFNLEKPTIEVQKVMLDKEKISLAFQNILDNAVKYTPVGGRVNVSFRVGKKALEFKVKDSGIGISNNEKKKLFTKFFRGNNALKMEAMGSGLGLFIAKNIIENHHGKIWFESKKNNGTTFFVRIPIE